MSELGNISLAEISDIITAQKAEVDMLRGEKCMLLVEKMYMNYYLLITMVGDISLSGDGFCDNFKCKTCPLEYCRFICVDSRLADSKQVFSDIIKDALDRGLI